MEKIKIFFKKFFTINDTPHKIAGGAALGVFWGIMPGEGIATTIITASILRLNRFSATAGVLAANMWTTIAILPLAAGLGGWIFGLHPGTLVENFQSTFNLGFRFFFTETIFSQLLLPLVVGFAIISLALSLAFYFLIYFLLKTKRVSLK